jgi:anthranilate synthase component II
MIVLIDNYDSFSYNLVQMIGSIEPDIKVVRNDQVTVDDIESMKPSHLILSPGPGYPRDAGILEEAVIKLKGKMPILGVCLGHQGICEAFGGTIAHAKYPTNPPVKGGCPFSRGDLYCANISRSTSMG